MNLWQHIQSEISKATNNSFQIADREIVSGGDINQCIRISDGASEYFVKCNDVIFVDMFKAEANGLEALRQTNQFKIPKVITYGNSENSCYLVLEYLNFTGSNLLKLFGEQLAKLHATTNNQFGFYGDNFIGKTKQQNPWSENWGGGFHPTTLGLSDRSTKAKRF